MCMQGSLSILILGGMVLTSLHLGSWLWRGVSHSLEFMIGGLVDEASARSCGEEVAFDRNRCATLTFLNSLATNNNSSSSNNFLRKWDFQDCPARTEVSCFFPAIA